MQWESVRVIVGVMQVNCNLERTLPPISSGSVHQPMRGEVEIRQLAKMAGCLLFSIMVDSWIFTLLWAVHQPRG